MSRPRLAVKFSLALAAVVMLMSAVSPALAQTAASVAPDDERIARLFPLDWLVIAAYFGVMLAIGWYYSRRTATTDDYLLGGRNMRSSSVGLSLFATLMSTITYLALPGEMINKGPVILCWMFGLPIVYLVVGYLLIPHFMRLQVTSAYELLEMRLGLEGRLLAALMFLATRMLWMALIIYITTDKLIIQMMHWPSTMTPWVAAAIGIVTVIYTSMGGLRAVVLTDVIQSFILIGGALLCLIVITGNMGGVDAWWPREWSPTWDRQKVFTWDPTERVTVVGSFVFMTLWWICTAGSDQMAIQRYLATRDVAAARRVFLVTLVANVVITSLLVAVGFALLGFFRADPHNLGPGMTVERDADSLFPYYIVRFLPPGITGLVIAGLLAAAMSSLSSGINSACSVISSDFISRFRRMRVERGFPVQVVRLPGAKIARHPVNTPDESVGAPVAVSVLQTKWIAVASGLVAVLLSFVIGKVSGNIMAVTVKTNHVFVAPLFGLFFMALFVPFATPFGAVFGALYGAAAAVIVGYWHLLTGQAELSFQWITLVSLTVNLVAGILLSKVPLRGRSPSAQLVTTILAVAPLVAVFVYLRLGVA